MKTGKKEIEEFLQPRRLAVAGVSRNNKKFGSVIFKELSDKGYDVLPINPNTDKINGKHCYKGISELPADITSLLIVTPKTQTNNVLREAINKGIKNIWVQQFSETEQTIKIAEEYQKEIIHDRCIFMFAEPVAGVHKFHRAILKLFGALPK